VLTQAAHEEEGPEQDDEAIPRAKVSEILTIAQEEDLVEWFQVHPLFYDQTLKDFKMRAKRERLLDEKAKLMGLNGTCPLNYSNCLKSHVLIGGCEVNVLRGMSSECAQRD
jgi:hypothetical protein